MPINHGIIPAGIDNDAADSIGASLNADNNIQDGIIICTGLSAGAGTIIGGGLNVSTGNIQGGNLNVGIGNIRGGAIVGTDLNIGIGNIQGGTITGTGLNVGNGVIQGGAITGTKLSVAGPISTQVTVKTAEQSPYNILDLDSVILADAVSSDVTLVLPTAVGILGQQYILKRIDNSENTVTVETTSSQKIDGTTSFSLAGKNSIMVISDGDNWWIV